MSRGLRTAKFGFMSIEQHVEGLRAERETLRQELSTLRARVGGLEQLIEMIDEGIAALSGKKRTVKSQRRGVTKADVASEIVEVLRAGPMTEADLKARVGSSLKAKGVVKQLTGYPLRFTQALGSVSVRVDGDLVTLEQRVDPAEGSEQPADPRSQLP